MKRSPLLWLWIPSVVLACGGSFYEAPPTLDLYPERLPGKSMRVILRETQPPVANPAGFEQLLEEIRQIGLNFTVFPRKELVRRIERGLSRNREGEYRKRFANCLYDFRDLLSQPGIPAAEIKQYCQWRLDAMEWDNGLFSRPPKGEADWSEERLAAEQASWEERQEKTTADLMGADEKASPGLKPHWQILIGAWAFNHRDWDAAARSFERIGVETPRHPRAEVALLMLARVRIEQWRAAKTKADWNGGRGEQAETEELRKLYKTAEDALDAYLAVYPKGRFAIDIPGWKGGLARESGWWAQAISLFLQQTDTKGHPEVVRGALKQCEVCLEQIENQWLENSSNDPVSVLPIAEIAKRPLAAMALVYHFLDSRDQNTRRALFGADPDLGESDHDLIRPVLQLRRIGRVILPALARAVVANKANYEGRVWRPKYLAVLAWAASQSGSHQEAVRICELAGPLLSDSDDLLFARAVALQRSGELAEAILGYQKLKNVFPQSPLTAEVDFRIATALRDQHQAGFAVVDFMQIDAGQETRAQSILAELQNGVQQRGGGVLPEEPTYLHERAEVQQWIDVLLKFSPLKELEAALSKSLPAERAERVRNVLKMRYLAQENFIEAARFEQTGENVGLELKNLTEELRAAPTPQLRAEKALALAEAWASQRGNLCLPLAEEGGDVFSSDLYQSWRVRLQNAQTAGHTPEAASAEMEGWDEQRHAFAYYIRAADAWPGSTLAAHALWRANESLRQIAELSPWGMARAFETKVSTQSRQLHERLLKECPNSQEAKQKSVWWSFAPALETKWMPADRGNHAVEVAIGKVFSPSIPALDDYESNRGLDAFRERLKQLGAQAKTLEVSALKAELAAIRKEFLPTHTSANYSWVINHIDDLSLFLQEPGLTPSSRERYFQVRLSESAPNLNDSETQPYRDYLTFIALVRERGPINPTTGEESRRPMSERMAQFLKEFPRSKKREAALARWSISTIREYLGHTGVVSSTWPEAPKLRGYKTIEPSGRRECTAKMLHSALDRYEKEFPKGRYQAEMRLWRAAVHLADAKWQPALNGLVATLDDPTHLDLHLDAALHLADLYLRLIDEPASRADLISAIASNPGSQKRLFDFMRSDTLGARLAVFEGFLREHFTAQK